MPITGPTSAPRVAVVTGAARGIGAATARRLAHDGLAVAVLDLREEDCARTLDEIHRLGGSGLAVAADVADEAQVATAIARVAAELGPPTVVVNDAGVAHAAAFVDTPAADWDHVVAVNLRGTFLVTRAVVPHMQAAGSGRVVTVSSVSALGDPGRVAYASAKAGLIGFTRTLATELGPSGVTVNAVAPGFTVSAMTDATARRLGRTPEDHRRLVAETIPVGRVGQPEDVAHAVSFFVGPEAGFVSGQVLYVAGGPA